MPNTDAPPTLGASPIAIAWQLGREGTRPAHLTRSVRAALGDTKARSGAAGEPLARRQDKPDSIHDRKTL